MKKFPRVLALFVAVGILLAATGCTAKTTGRDYTVAVITKATDSDFWNNVYKGVNAASTEYNVDTIFMGPESENDYAAQNRMIQDAVKDGADVIVLSAIDYNLTAPCVSEAIAAGVPVIMIDSGVDCPEISSFIGTDNYRAGIEAGKAAVESVKNRQKIAVGLVNYDPNPDNGQQREAGVRDYLKTVPNAEIMAQVSVDTNLSSAISGVITMLNNHPEINVVIGFNEWTTLGVGYAIRQLGLSEKVASIGFDSNVVSIGMLETGEMDALVVQNPFAIGYLGVQRACLLLDGKKIERTLKTQTTVITKQNMFDTDNQKVLFPFK